jgi:hypothetical protein
VRVHTGPEADASARAAGALAYTVGRDVVFRAGGYAPAQAEGRRLLAHELVHTLQPAAPASPHAPVADDPAAEAEADRAAGAVTAPDSAEASAPALAVPRPAVARDTPPPREIGQSDQPGPPKDMPEAPWAKKLDEIMPKHRGLVAEIIRDTTLVDVLGHEQLTDMVNRIAADQAAKDFVKQAGVSAIVALADTRVKVDLDVAAAKQALKDNPDRYSVKKGLKLHVLPPDAKVSAAGPTLWFNDPAAVAAASSGGSGGITTSADQRLQTFIDDTTPAFGGVKVQFAYSAGEVSASGVSKPVQDAKLAIGNAVAQVIADLGSWSAGTVAEVEEQQRVRARLKEALKGFDAKHPLRIYIAVDLTPDEMAKGLAAQTDRVWIDAKDVNDPKKLQGAIRIPLTMLTGGFLPGGGGQQVPAIGAADLSHTMMHELVHRLLIERNSDGSSIWDAAKAKVVLTGPANQVTLVEALIRKLLIAQEEVFTYDNEGALYPPVPIARGVYALWEKQAEQFLKDRGATFTTVTRKLPVSEKVGKKAVDWQIDYRVPEMTYTLTGPDRSDAAALFAQYPG